MKTSLNISGLKVKGRPWKHKNSLYEDAESHVFNLAERQRSNQTHEKLNYPVHLCKSCLRVWDVWCNSLLCWMREHYMLKNKIAFCGVLNEVKHSLRSPSQGPQTDDEHQNDKEGDDETNRWKIIFCGRNCRTCVIIYSITIYQPWLIMGKMHFYTFS